MKDGGEIALDNIGNVFESLNKEGGKHKFSRVPILIASNWIFQGILYMDRTERAFRISVELILISLIGFSLSFVLNLTAAFLFAILFIHTMNWMLNGQFFALFKKFGLVHTRKEEFEIFCILISRNAIRNGNLNSVLAYGSLARGSLDVTSDLDIRMIRKKGYANAISACVFAMQLRIIAFIKKFPLDIYVFDGVESLRRMKENVPVKLYENVQG